MFGNPQPSMWCPGIELSRPLAQGLVGYWPFWEADGNKVRDLSGNGNAGTGNGATWADSPMGPALDFDGVAHHVNCGTGKSLEVQAHTIVARVLIRDNGFNSLFTKESVTADGYLWGFRGAGGAGGNLSFAYYDGSIEGWDISNTEIPLNTWMTVAGTWSPSRGTVEYFQNGKYTDSDVTSNDPIIHDSSRVAYIGDRTLSATEHFNGQIAWLLLYGRILSNGEIQRLVADPHVLIRPRQKVIWGVAAVPPVGSFTPYYYHHFLGGGV